ncbi:fungal-specific transcription factor domain-containing protein [Rhodocollybia butyracea]|uniref:Fungal-specific transcription factor domain-containing protein n=1 Tax=Rhodocollybia butyracea TaxID=206335 RepID=A0A9P5PPU5_9AGAR|nr:fungal-specific transcription factor domain-containing protein [Rhodocollybia butyracea]
MKSEPNSAELYSASSSSRSRSTSKSIDKSTTFRFQPTEDSDNDDDEGGRKRPNATKASAACVHCKSLKVKCEPTPGENACRRCRAANISCQSRSRKKRKAAPTHEDLQEKAHSQDCQIQALLLQFDKMRCEKTIQTLISRAHSGEPFGGYDTQQYLHKLQSHRQRTDNSLELAVTSYFSPDRSLSTLSLPDIVKHCCLYPRDVLDLFSIFFDKINPFFSTFDPELHTPQKLIWTCPFLFTVICATASRYCTTKPGLYPLAIDFAREAAGQALVEGSKRIDICQAYLLLGVYPSPKKKWAEDRSWLFMGVAIRMALELELNLPPPPHCDEREALNRTRTWLNCYCVDGSHAIQFGKMPMLRLDDYMARTTQDWYRSSPLNTPYDVHLCAYVQILLIMCKWRSMAQGDNLSLKNMDVVDFSIKTEEQISNEWSMWFERYEEEYIHNRFILCYYRANTTEMITAYLRLVVLAAGFQHAFKSGISRKSDILRRSIDAAMTVIQIMVERLFPTGHLKYAMEANFLYVSFSAAYLLNLLRPKLLPLLDENTHQEIIVTVTRLIEVLGSKEVAMDERHTPALYSRFLVNLLRKYHTRRTRSETPPDGVRFHPQYGDERGSSPPGWPDIRHAGGPSNAEIQVLSGYEPGIIYQEAGDPDMDFSLNHFVRTVTEAPITQSDITAGMGFCDQWPAAADRPDGWSTQHFPLDWGSQQGL